MNGGVSPIFTRDNNAELYDTVVGGYATPDPRQELYPATRTFGTGAFRGTDGRHPATRTFGTGAFRDTDENKLDFEGFLSPLVLKAFAEYMHAKRKMPDGALRESDNWQKGVPLDVYMKSMWRHFFDAWATHRGRSGGYIKDGEIAQVDIETELLALLFNVQGYLHEILKAKQ
jgi:hypothetical protein